MNVTDIAFPHLGIYLENVPKSFSVFGYSVAFYGLIIGLGILFGTLLATKIAKVSGQDPDIYWDFIIYAVIFAIIGARIYYVAFEWENYRGDFLSIINIRNGGLAIYGGVIGAFATLFIYARIKKLNPFTMGDTAIPGLILGQCIGRWGNFMNREAFGGHTDSLLAMRLPIEAVRTGDISGDIAAHIQAGTNYIQVHPTFLYESMWNLMLLILILFYRKHKRFEGELCLIYFGGYGLGRFFIESLRADQLLIPGTSIPVSMVVSAVLIAFALITGIWARLGAKGSEDTSE